MNHELLLPEGIEITSINIFVVQEKRQLRTKALTSSKATT